MTFSAPKRSGIAPTSGTRSVSDSHLTARVCTAVAKSDRFCAYVVGVAKHWKSYTTLRTCRRARTLPTRLWYPEVAPTSFKGHSDSVSSGERTFHLVCTSALIVLPQL